MISHFSKEQALKYDEELLKLETIPEEEWQEQITTSQDNGLDEDEKNMTDMLDTEQRKELENALLALEKEIERKQDNETPSPNSQALEALMSRLFAASVGKDELVKGVSETTLDVSESVDVGEANLEDDLEEPLEKEQAENESDEDSYEFEDTGAKVDFAIEVFSINKQIQLQLQGVKDSEHLIANDQERQYFDAVVEKLTSQLDELQEIKVKIYYYRSILKDGDQDQELQHATIQPQETEEVKECFRFN